jgi:hypothetical protein
MFLLSENELQGINGGSLVGWLIVIGAVAIVGCGVYNGYKEETARLEKEYPKPTPTPTPYPTGVSGYAR